jgi:predicted CXXCH cytochrome family protein
VRRMGILVAGCTVLLTTGVGVAPAFADNGPHKSTTNVMNEDRCAGCHRAHTASAAYLLKDDEQALCETCHGSLAGGSALDVKDGVGYTDSDRGTAAGALRGGGFDFALISSGSGVIARRQPNGPIVPALSAGSGVATTSRHEMGTGTAWGGGATGAGTSVALECGSCHDPHGGANGGAATFRILKPNPGTGVMVGSVASAASNGTTISVVTAATTTLKTGQTVTLTGMLPDTYNVSGLITVTDGTHFAFTPTTAPAAGSSTQNGLVLTSAGRVGTVTSVTADGTTVTYTYTADPNWTLAVGDVVNITGTSVTGYNLSSQKITAVGSGTFSITNAATAGSGTGGYVTMSNTAVADVVDQPVTGTIANAVASGGFITYTTSAATTLVSGNMVTISSISPSTLGGSGIEVYVIDSTHFRIKSAVTDAYVSGGSFTTAGTAYTYTSQNFWLQDDANGKRVKSADANGVASTTTVTALENNISRWCTTCHTRLLAGSGSYKTALTVNGASDAMYTFRHRSDTNTKGPGTMGDSPNCLTCHVSHGSNAQMGTLSNGVTYPGSTLAGSSFLLRVDSRGTCQMCHNK